ncbi:MAG: DNA polymerase III subunit delta [Deltaproteobacteria bacterium]|nr:DNA polymerase III subunit delta [Deltaproteobacteria bacterium]
MSVSMSALARAMAKGKPAGCYLVAGEEEALVDRALEIIREGIFGERGPDEFSFSRLDGRGASAAEVEAASRTASLFGGHRLVVLREAEQLQPAEQKKLLAYLAAPVKGSTLVLVVRGAGPKTRDPRRAKAAKAAKTYAAAVEKGGGVVVDCPRPRARELPGLVDSLLADQGLSADTDGRYALVEAIGEDLGALLQAVAKLVLYKGGRGRVSAADVAEVVADTRSESIFDLTDAAAGGDLARALTVLRRMLRDGEAALPILAQLVRHFRTLAAVQALARRGEPAESIHKALGLHPFVVRKALQQSRRFSDRRLADRIDELDRADLALKGGSRLDDELKLERLLMRLCARDR